MEKMKLFEIREENLKWFKENYEDLKTKYDSKWVIVQNGKVVETATTFDEVMTVAKKYNPNSIIVEYIESKPIAMFF